jgi:hypothetical protein
VLKERGIAEKLKEILVVNFDHVVGANFFLKLVSHMQVQGMTYITQALLLGLAVPGLGVGKTIFIHGQLLQNTLLKGRRTREKFLE